MSAGGEGVIKNKFISSCSSEISHFPADNLLIQSSSHSSQGWKGAINAENVVQIQLERSSVINAIHIGNLGTALLEVLVGHSCGPKDEYKVLLPVACLLTPKEIANVDMHEKIKIFGYEKLNAEVRNSKWDVVRLICRQPFLVSKHNYGLKFVTFKANSAPTASTKPSLTRLGSFVLKPEKPEMRRPAPGSLFLKKSQDDKLSPIQQLKILNEENKGKIITSITPPAPTYEANPITKKPTTITTPTNRPTTTVVNKPFVQTKQARSSTTTTTTTTTTTITSNRQRLSNLKMNKQLDNSINNTNNNNEARGSPEGKLATTIKKSPKSPFSVSYEAAPKNEIQKKAVSQIIEKTPKKKVVKDFKHIFDGVVIVLSGYVNPQRSDLRDKTLEMGGDCERDWSKKCTHLICAFSKTPKLQQVQASGHGKIVGGDWVLDCYKNKKLLPTKKYSLVDDDDDEEEEEEEEEDEEEDEQQKERDRQRELEKEKERLIQIEKRKRELEERRRKKKELEKEKELSDEKKRKQKAEEEERKIELLLKEEEDKKIKEEEEKNNEERKRKEEEDRKKKEEQEQKQKIDDTEQRRLKRLERDEEEKRKAKEQAQLEKRNQLKRKKQEEEQAKELTRKRLKEEEEENDKRKEKEKEIDVYDLDTEESESDEGDDDEKNKSVEKKTFTTTTTTTMTTTTMTAGSDNNSNLPDNFEADTESESEVEELDSAEIKQVLESQRKPQLITSKTHLILDSEEEDDDTLNKKSPRKEKGGKIPLSTKKPAPLKAQKTVAFFLDAKTQPMDDFMDAKTQPMDDFMNDATQPMDNFLNEETQAMDFMDEPTQSMDMDLDDDNNDVDQKQKNDDKGYLPELFKGLHVFIYGKMDHGTRSIIERYFVAYGGSVDNHMRDQTTHIITLENWSDEFDTVASENPRLQFVRPKWIFECHNKKKLVPPHRFFVT